MTSLDLLGYHKLDTVFFNGHVQHTTFHSGASQGRSRAMVVKSWYRGRELGRGSFGTVFLEESREGELRAVKEIAKDKNSRKAIDYRRELMAMAILAKHSTLFVQLLGWYESDDYVHIAMEYISHGHLRHYLEVERSEGEAKAVTRQLLEGLLIIHQEGFAHRDLKPENIFVVSTSPIRVKIGDFGFAKLVKDGSAFRTEGGTRDYVAPEMGVDNSRETSEYTNAIDIWALGCITHEMLTQTLPFRGFRELSSYCLCPELPKDTMLSKNISRGGIEFVERALAYPPERRIAAREALDLDWLRLEDRVDPRTVAWWEVLTNSELRMRDFERSINACGVSFGPVMGVLRSKIEEALENLYYEQFPTERHRWRRGGAPSTNSGGGVGATTDPISTTGYPHAIPNFGEAKSYTALAINRILSQRRLDRLGSHTMPNGSIQAFLQETYPNSAPFTSEALLASGLRGLSTSVGGRRGGGDKGGPGVFAGGFAPASSHPRKRAKLSAAPSHDPIVSYYAHSGMHTLRPESQIIVEERSRFSRQFEIALNGQMGFPVLL